MRFGIGSRHIDTLLRRRHHAVQDFVQCRDRMVDAEHLVVEAGADAAQQVAATSCGRRSDSDGPAPLTAKLVADLPANDVRPEVHVYPGLEHSAIVADSLPDSVPFVAPLLG
ncbi:hypothetical protein ACW2Q0_26215 [Nocardia sp. R16R-3T]